MKYCQSRTALDYQNIQVEQESLNEPFDSLEFDWRGALSEVLNEENDEKKGEIISSYRLYDRANHFFSCACSQLPRILYSGGTPANDLLKHAGMAFFRCINKEDYVGALKMLDEIEELAAELLSQLEENVENNKSIS